VPDGGKGKTVTVMLRNGKGGKRVVVVEVVEKNMAAELSALLELEEDVGANVVRLEELAVIIEAVVEEVDPKLLKESEDDVLEEADDRDSLAVLPDVVDDIGLGVVDSEVTVEDDAKDVVELVESVLVFPVELDPDP
jgi:hypothetical protein